MAINKVEFGDQTLIDLTSDTVTQQDVLNGKTFHSADGVVRSGTATTPSVLDDLTDVSVTSPSNGQVLKYDASNNEWVNANEGAVEIIPNPVDTPTAQLNSLGFYGTNVVTVLDNGLVSTSSAYAWASYRTALVTGVTYDLKLTDSFYPSNPIYSSFTWQGSTIVLTLGDRKELTIEETRAGLTYFPGAWRQHYLDIKSQIQSTIYSVGSVTDVEVDGTSVVNAQGVAEIDLSGKVSKSGDTINGNLTVTGDLTAPYAYIDTLNYHDSITNKSLNITKPQTISTGGTIQVPDKGGTMALTSDVHVDDVEVNGISVVDANKIAKITSYKEITRAEYEALPDTKLTDGIAYFITDGSSAKVQGYPPLIYSDEEREVGVWRDGKPLYQKTIHMSANFSSTKTYSIPTAEDLFLVDGFFVCASGSTQYQVPLDYTESGYSSYSGWNKTAHNVYFKLVGFSSTDVYATVRYTKTADTAGSGTWNGQGGLAHHYSTSETVIGTWIDGKPLYERTFELTQQLDLTQNTWVKSELDQGTMKGLFYVLFTNALGACLNNISGGFIDNKIAFNSPRTTGFAPAENAKVTLQYTKTTD